MFVLTGDIDEPVFEGAGAVDDSPQAIREHAKQRRDAGEHEHGRDRQLDDVRNGGNLDFWLHG